MRDCAHVGHDLSRRMDIYGRRLCMRCDRLVKVDPSKPSPPKPDIVHGWDDLIPTIELGLGLGVSW